MGTKVKVEETNFVTHLIITAMQDPDLELRWGGGGLGGGAHPDPLHKGGGRCLKKFFPPFGPQFGLPLYSTIILLNISEPVC